MSPMGSLGDSGASVRGRTGFSHGCKISAPSVRDTLRPYRDRDPRPTPRRHVGLRTRARSLAARDGAPRPRRRRRATCSSHVWSLDVVVTVPLPLGRGPRPSSRLTPALPPRSSLHGARTSVSRLHGPDFRGASRLPARPVPGARGRAPGARRPAPGGGRCGHAHGLGSRAGPVGAAAGAGTPLQPRGCSEPPKSTTYQYISWHVASVACTHQPRPRAWQVGLGAPAPAPAASRDRARHYVETPSGGLGITPE